MSWRKLEYKVKFFRCSWPWILTANSVHRGGGWKGGSGTLAQLDESQGSVTQRAEEQLEVTNLYVNEDEGISNLSSRNGCLPCWNRRMMT